MLQEGKRGSTEASGWEKFHRASRVHARKLSLPKQGGGAGVFRYDKTEMKKKEAGAELGDHGKKIKLGRQSRISLGVNVRL